MPRTQAVSQEQYLRGCSSSACAVQELNASACSQVGSPDATHNHNLRTVPQLSSRFFDMGNHVRGRCHGQVNPAGVLGASAGPGHQHLEPRRCLTAGEIHTLGADILESPTIVKMQVVCHRTPPRFMSIVAAGWY